MLVRNAEFAKDIRKQIGQKVDVSEIDIEISNFKHSLVRLECSKNNLIKDIDNIFDDDEYALCKRKDMNIRLNKLYEEIYVLEDEISDCQCRKEACERDSLTQDNIYKILLHFNDFFDKMNLEDKRAVLSSLIEEVHLHPKETWEVGKNPIKSIKYTFPIGGEVLDALGENSSSVECVVLMSRK